MERGIIKKYFADKGYGYIALPDGREIYFRPSAEKEKLVKVDAEVEFELSKDKKGRLSARSLCFIGAPQPQRIQQGINNGGAARAQRQRTQQGNNDGRAVPAQPSFYLPSDTSKALEGEKRPRENSALEVEKYFPFQADRQDPRGNTVNGKIADAKRERSYSQREKELLSALNEVQKNIAGNYSHTVTSKLGSRMVVGLGSASVFETGIILHKPYGFPYIPGSSIKGAMRGFLVKEYTRQLDIDTINTLFGTQTKKGSLTFFDAYPTAIDKLELDIMNPHFPEWYSGKAKAPTDDQSPVPIKFLAVPAGTKFTFRIGGAGVCPVFKTAFEEMLEYAGLGAKTAVGYGWMQILNSN
jgi:CRISPR-associated protein Cmr6